MCENRTHHPRLSSAEHTPLHANKNIYATIYLPLYASSTQLLLLGCCSPSHLLAVFGKWATQETTRYPTSYFYSLTRNCSVQDSNSPSQYSWVTHHETEHKIVLCRTRTYFRLSFHLTRYASCEQQCCNYFIRTTQVIQFNRILLTKSFDFSHVIQSVGTVVVIHHCLLTYGRYFTSPAHHEVVLISLPQCYPKVFAYGTAPACQCCLAVCRSATD